MMLTLKHKHHVYFAVSYGTYILSGTDSLFFYQPENINIWKVRGNRNTIMAGGKNSRDNDLLRYTPLFKGELSMEKVMNQIIPKMTSIFGKYGRMEKDQSFGNTFFIAQKDVVFQINPDRSVIHIDTCAANDNYTLMHASILLTKHQNAHDIIKEAIERVMTYYGNVHLPIALMDTHAEKIIYIKE
jgi:phenylacetate-coenzyme A ligase PaaK-like adenylate-forming protein